MHGNWLGFPKANPYICIGRHGLHVPTSGTMVAPVNNKPVSGVLNIISSYTIIWNPAINPAGQSRPVHTSPVTSKRKSGAERRIRSISDNGCCHLKSVPLYLKDLTTR